MAFARKRSQTLEGRVVLIAGSSPSSVELRDDMFRDFSRDHQMQGRVITLDTEWGPYNNGNQNFILKDPENVLSDNDIGKLIRNSQSFFVTKLENPFLTDPHKYVLDDLVDTFGKKFVGIRNSMPLMVPKGMTQRTFHNEQEKRARHSFQSHMAHNLPRMLDGVAKSKKLDESLIPYTRTLYDIFMRFRSDLIESYGKGSDATDPKLAVFKYAFKGCLEEVIQKRSKPFFYDELYAMTNRIGIDIIRPGDIGGFNWIIPFLDGRSDKVKNSRLGECVRAREDARYARYSGVNAVLTFRAHSQTQADFFESEDKLLPDLYGKRSIKFINLTQTNEQISLVGQKVKLDETYVLSPDEGGVEDAMVFARELYIRSNGRFKGRVVVFRKKRAVVGDVSDMDFLSYYVYDPEKDNEGMVFDLEGRPQPYDLVHSRNYKNKESAEWIGHKFSLAYRKEVKDGKVMIDEENKVKDQITGHTGLIKDDIIDTGTTMIKAILRANTCYHSRSYAIAEHPCFTRDCIERLSRLYDDEILDGVITSTSIMHPNYGKRPWHYTIPISERLKNQAKRVVIEPWLGQHFPAQMDNIRQLTYRKPVS